MGAASSSSVTSNVIAATWRCSKLTRRVEATRTRLPPGAMCRVALDGGTGGDSSGGSEEESGSDEHRRGGGSPVPVDEQEVRCSRAAPRSPPLTNRPGGTTW